MAGPIRQRGHVAVVGAGVSGLFYAYFLTRFRPDIAITVYERQARPGGWIRSVDVTNNSDDNSISTPPICFEKGPRTLRGVSSGTVLIVDTLRQLGKQDEVMVLPKQLVANRKYVWGSKANRLVPVPNSMRELIPFLKGTGLAQLAVAKGFLQERKKPVEKDDESVGDFFKRRLGTTALVDNVLSAVLHGIYAGDANNLSVKALLPKLKQWEADYGSLLAMAKSKVGLKLKPFRLRKPPAPLMPEVIEWYKGIADTNMEKLAKELKQYPMVALKLGLETLPKALFQYLSERPQVKFVFNADLKSVTLDGKVDGKQYDHVRLTTNADSLAKLIDNAELQAVFTQLKSVDILLINIYTADPWLINHHGFGFLVPRLAQPNREGLLGIIFDLDVEQNVRPFFPNAEKRNPEASDKDNAIKLSRATKPYHKITLMMGGHYFTGATPLEAEIRQLVCLVLTRYLGVDCGARRFVYVADNTDAEKSVAITPTDVVISPSFNRQCIPQYHTDYPNQRQFVHDTLRQTKISIGGMAYGGGVGVPDCVWLLFDAAAAHSYAECPQEPVLVSQEQAQIEAAAFAEPRATTAADDVASQRYFE